MYDGVDIMNASKLELVPRVQDNIEKKFIVDTNVIISMITDPNYAYNFGKNFHDDEKFVIVDEMWNEIQRITGLMKQVITYHVERHLGKFEIIPSKLEVREYAYSVQSKTNSVCHWPDSLMVVHGVWNQWTVITHDSDLLKSCDKYNLETIRLDSSGVKSQPRGRRFGIK